jgi:hypothetical protein
MNKTLADAIAYMATRGKFPAGYGLNGMMIFETKPVIASLQTRERKLANGSNVNGQSVTPGQQALVRAILENF